VTWADYSEKAVKFIIQGINKSTGKEERFEVEAASSDDAVRTAGNRGFAIVKAQPVRQSLLLSHRLWMAIVVVLSVFAAWIGWPRAVNKPSHIEFSLNESHPGMIWQTKATPELSARQMIEPIARRGSWWQLRELLEENPSLAKWRDKFGRCLIHEAASTIDDSTGILILAQKKADLYARDSFGRTPLYSAADFGNKECVRTLLIMASKSVMLADEIGQTPLHMAAGDGAADIIEMLIAAGADANANTMSEVTPLHMAATSRKIESVNALIHNGAFVNSQTRDVQTPLDWAMHEGDHAMAEYLRIFGGVTSKQ
jgi:hypothetical protein